MELGGKEYMKLHPGFLALSICTVDILLVRGEDLLALDLLSCRNKALHMFG